MVYLGFAAQPLSLHRMLLSPWCSQLALPQVQGLRSSCMLLNPMLEPLMCLHRLFAPP